MKKTNDYSIKQILKDLKTIEILTLVMVLFSLMVKVFYFQFTSQLNTRPFSKTMNLWMLVSNLGIFIIVSGLILLIFNRKKILGLFILDLFIGVLLLADTVYFRYYYSALSVTMVYQLKLAGSIGDSIMSLLRWKDLVYIIDLPLIVLIIYMVRKYNIKKDREVIGKRLIKSSIMMVIGVGLIFISLKNTDTSTFPYDNNYIIRHGGVGFYHYYDMKEFIKNNYLIDRKLSKEERVEILNHINGKEVPAQAYRGISKDKNLIVIQVEALQHFIINAKTPKGEEISPNLNQLIKESKYFDNIYYQTGGGNTSDAELLVNTSLYPAKEGAAYFLYPNNKFDSLGNILKERGYKNYASHANNPTFWNRVAIYPSLGFDDFYSNKRFELDEYVGWGLGDKSFYKQTIDKIGKEDPFYTMMVSLSSHYPFKYKFFEEYEFDVGEYEDSFIGYYMKSVHYADMAIGSLIDYLKEEGLYENSLIVIYGDHQAVPKEKSQELFEFLGMEFDDIEWTKLQKVPLIVHDPDIKDPEIIETIGGQIDIMPTIANLMDFNVPYALGKDLLNTDKSYAILRNSTIITDKYIYLSSDGKLYDSDSGALLEEEIYRDEIDSYHRELYISDTILKKNALKTLKKTE